MGIFDNFSDVFDKVGGWLSPDKTEEEKLTRDIALRRLEAEGKLDDSPWDYTPMAPIAAAIKPVFNRGLFHLSKVLKEELEPQLSQMRGLVDKTDIPISPVATGEKSYSKLYRQMWHMGPEEEELFGKPTSILGKVFEEEASNFRHPLKLQQKDARDMYDHFINVNGYLKGEKGIPSAYNPSKILSKEIIIPESGGRGLRMNEVLDLFATNSSEKILNTFKAGVFLQLPKKLLSYLGEHDIGRFFEENNIYTIAASFPKEAASWLSSHQKYWYR